MLKKIISIKNVGRFRNSAASPNPQLGKHTFIAGANGYGKTTICAVLRSLQTGDPAHVLGRKTLGATAAPVIGLLLDSGQARFDGAAWNATKPEISIFDGVFVAENVHSGEVVDSVCRSGHPTPQKGDALEAQSGRECCPRSRSCRLAGVDCLAV